MLPGLIEIVSPYFVIGWARLVDQQSSHVYASLGGKIIGWAVADIVRNDLKATGAATAPGAEVGRGFAILFEAPLSPASFGEIKVISLEDSAALPRGNRVQYDKRDPLQLFILGSPRSGTSEMGQTLASVLELRGSAKGTPRHHSVRLRLH